MDKHSAYYMSTYITQVNAAISNLSSAFIFASTDEGLEYWSEVLERLEAIRDDYYRSRGHETK